MNQPPWNPNQPPQGYPQGYPQQQPAPGFGQGYPAQVQGQGPYQPQFVPGIAVQQPAPGYGQGYPQPPQFAQPAGYPAQQLPQNAPRYQQNAPMVDLDSAGEADAEYPKLHPAQGRPWALTLGPVTEQPSFHQPGTTIVWVTATVRPDNTADPAYTPGMSISIKVDGFGHPTKNNKAQARLKSLLSACTREPTTAAYAPGHWTARKAQLLQGQMAGAPFSVIMSAKVTQNVDPATGQRRSVLLPTFMAG